MENKSNLSATEKLRQWISTSVTLKLFGIGIIILILLIPLSFVTDLVRERASRKQEAIQEVSAKWGDPQTIQAAILSVPYRYTSKTAVYGNDGRIVSYDESQHRDILHIYPESSFFSGDVVSSIRERGIFEIPVYETKISCSGEWSLENLKLKIPEQAEKILWDEAFVSILLSDLGSLNAQVALEIMGKEYPCSPEKASSGQSMLKASLDLQEDQETELLKYSTVIDFKGTSAINFAPLAKTTQVEISSNWPHPQFTGSTLPEHDIVDGFKAKWTMLHLNRPLAQEFTGLNPDQNASLYNFGVELYTPADNYQRTERSAKYALLLICLTFALFFFVQILKKVRIHPVQYILVGLSLVVFYTLLLSFSEHLIFFYSYLIAAGATSLLITGYVHASFRNKGFSWSTGLTLAVLFGFIYSTLRMEDYALLAGSLGIFAAVGMVMYITRNVNWYNLKESTLN